MTLVSLPQEMRSRLVRWLLSALILLGTGTSACRYWAGPLPLGTPNDLRTTDARSRSWAKPMHRPGLPNLHKVSDDLYRGAQPTAEGIKELDKLGIKTIINVRSSYSDRDILAATDLAYEHIPMTPWHVEDEDIVRFLQIVTNEHCTPVFVHCRRGADRTGLAVAVYRIAIQGWSKDEAIAEMTQGGFAFYDGWQNLIRYLRDLDIDALKHSAGLDRQNGCGPVAN